MLGVNDLVQMVQLNFMVDIEFLMSNMHPQTKFDRIPILVIHGLRESAEELLLQAKRWPNITVDTPFMRDRFGVHHTKAMLLFFRDVVTGIESVQLVVMTANLVDQDWQVMTQGVYRSPKFEQTAPFENDLLMYLKGYKLSCLSPIISKLKLYDWSPCKAILIGSIPGYHRQSASAFSNWGIEKLAKTLRQHVYIPEHSLHSQLIIQCSSMPHSPERWFKEDICKSMSECKNQHITRTQQQSPRVCVVFPTTKTATDRHNSCPYKIQSAISFTGRDMSGDFLRFEKTSYEKNYKWFDPYLYDWKSQEAGRQFLMPHIKTYTRLYTDKNDKAFIAWHLLTSANLSRAAWGEYQKNRTQIYIKSFELGVFFCPSLWETDDHSAVYMVPSASIHDSTKPEDEDDDIKYVQVCLPYDVPLTPHPEPLQCFTRL
ncbi:MAG: tyrosyl-DNA phosphodiesterase I [Benjaminiella poitrasii]|nr:MAG: tyrosyl-DNA phosphodiesterase I [Benjaminiella poitrasii]